MNYRINKSFAFFLVAVTFILSFSSCLNTDNPYDTYTAWIGQNEQFFDAEVKAYQDSAKLLPETYVVDSIPSNQGGGVIIYKYITKGTGTESPFYNSKAKVYYTGKSLKNGSNAEADMTIFDTTFRIVNKPGSNPVVPLTYEEMKFYNSPATFEVNSLIKGWTYLLQQLVAGDRVRVTIPWYLAYGANSQGAILPFSTLIFDVELVEVINP
ncbi:MAG: FKBP-type peptidyl-prolyl cis-trans isomerase [Bacteroidales bacterium]